MGGTVDLGRNSQYDRRQMSTELFQEYDHVCFQADQKKHPQASHYIARMDPH